MHSRIGLPILCRVSAQPSQPLPPPPHPSLQPPDTFPCFCPALTFSSLQPFDAFLPAAHFPGRMASRTGRPAAFPGRVQFKRKIFKNQAERRRTGGDPAQLNILTDLGEHAAALVGTHSCLATTRGGADPSLASRPTPQAQREAAPVPVPLQVIITTGGEETTEPEEEMETEEDVPCITSTVAPAATSSASTSTEEVVSPSSLQQATPMRPTVPTPTPRRLSQQGRHAL
uniref:uncharacterized protein isoform X4 n=2 Tax=Pristiophorus japonicus TaxID=55135 RepID=UPI00398F535C